VSKKLGTGLALDFLISPSRVAERGPTIESQHLCHRRVKLNRRRAKDPASGQIRSLVCREPLRACLATDEAANGQRRQEIAMREAGGGELNSGCLTCPQKADDVMTTSWNVALPPPNGLINWAQVNFLRSFSHPAM
jgi:hypothetical protein